MQTSIRIDDLKTDKIEDTYTWKIPLQTQSAGNYRIQANIMIDDFFWTETYYYFIIEVEDIQ